MNGFLFLELTLDARITDLHDVNLLSGVVILTDLCADLRQPLENQIITIVQNKNYAN